MTEAYTALVIWSLANACLIVRAVNGARYARLLHLDWGEYVESGFWGISGILGYIRIGYVLWTIYTTGALPDYFILGYLGWTGLIIGSVFIVFLAARKTIALQNAIRADEITRERYRQAENMLEPLRRRLNAR